MRDRANAEQDQLRAEISELEKQVRRHSNEFVAKQTESKNLQFLLSKERELQDEKAEKEQQALRLLTDDLRSQHDSIERQNG